MFTKSLPNITDISWLSNRITPYPVSRSEVVRIARRWNLPDSQIEFLRQFPSDKQFSSRAQFVQRCDELAVRIRREWQSPHKPTQLRML